jgi:hypothetical protein
MAKVATLIRTFLHSFCQQKRLEFALNLVGNDNIVLKTMQYGFQLKTPGLQCPNPQGLHFAIGSIGCVIKTNIFQKLGCFVMTHVTLFHC